MRKASQDNAFATPEASRKTLVAPSGAQREPPAWFDGAVGLWMIGFSKSDLADQSAAGRL